MSAFSQGLLEEDFFRSLIKKPPENFDELLSRAIKYVNVEEAQSARRKDIDSNQHALLGHSTPAVNGTDQRPLPQPLRGPDSGPHPTPSKTIHRAIQAVDTRPVRLSGLNRWLPRFCAYYQSRGHATHECHQYACELRQAAKQRSRRQSSPPRPRKSPTGRLPRDLRPHSSSLVHKRDRSPRRSIPST